jgi:hypothetical protein
MLHFAPAVVGNTNHPKSVTIIKGFPFTYGFLVIQPPFSAKTANKHVWAIGMQSLLTYCALD